MKKMNLFVLLMVITNAFLLVMVGYLGFFKSPNQLAPSTQTPNNKPPKRIAIMTPITHPALEEIEEGFKNTLAKEGSIPYEFTVYNANGNRGLMRSQAEDAIDQKFDLICTLGAGTSQMSKEIGSKKGSTAPIVFVAVSDPVKLGLVDSLESSKNNLTGVTEPRNIRLQVAALYALKKPLKKVLIAFDPGQDRQLEPDKDAFKALLEKEGVKVQSIEIYQTNEVAQKVTPFLHDTDVLIVLKDNTMVSSMEALVRLCNRHHVTLYASDLASSDKGAALAFGVPEYSFGVDAARKAKHILEKHVPPSAIPSTPVNDFKIKIHTANLKEQGLNLEPIFLFFAQHTVVV